MTDKLRNEGPGRLFRTLVVMGGSLALGCGGVAVDHDSDEHQAGTGGEPPSTGGAPTSTGGAGTGGSPASAGGTETGGSLGEPPVIPPITPGPFECPPSQWDCSSQALHCVWNTYSGSYAFGMPESCTCDLSKPTSVDDCAPGEVFACMQATADAESHPFDQDLPFDCSCVAAPVDCRDACRRDAYCGYYWSAPDLEPPESLLCGCAMPVLK